MRILEAFTYKLNAMEHAAENPLVANYIAKREAVLAFVAELAARVERAEVDSPLNGSWGHRV